MENNKERGVTIDLTPSWSSLVGWMLKLWEEDSKHHDNLLPEFKKMAAAADSWVKHIKEGEKDQPNTFDNNKGQERTS